MSAAGVCLVVGPAWVGDMVMAQSLFKILRSQSPERAVDVLAPAWSMDLVGRMPEVRRAMALPLGHGEFGFFARRRLGRALRGSGYAQAIVLPNSWKSALTPFFADIPLRTGFRGEWRYGLLNDVRRLDKRRLPMTVQRFAALGLPADAPAPHCPPPLLSVDTAGQQAAVAKFEIDPARPIVILCPGAEYGPAKRWPAAHFAEVARELSAQGRQVWLFGSAKDAAVAAEIVQLSGGVCRDFTGATTLAEAVDLMALAEAVVSNDSGLMHVAAALDKPLVALYGSSDPGFTPPLHAAAKILSLQLPCAPCFKRVCPLGHTHCLTQLPPQRVLAALLG